jgi:hypothetical protein
MRPAVIGSLGNCPGDQTGNMVKSHEGDTQAAGVLPKTFREGLTVTVEDPSGLFCKSRWNEPIYT